MHGEQLTEELLIKIEEAVANGANTNREIADSLKWTEEKFRSWKHGKRKNGEEESTRISTAIKKGEARQKGSLLRLAETAIAKMLTGYHEEETKTEESDIKGKTVTTTRKYYAPNATIAMFTAVNCSDGKWKSINNVQSITVTEKSKYEVELGE